jgi:hypothetical protein
MMEGWNAGILVFKRILTILSSNPNIETRNSKQNRNFNAQIFETVNVATDIVEIESFNGLEFLFWSL